jgi:hypothetical protein
VLPGAAQGGPARTPTSFLPSTTETSPPFIAGMRLPQRHPHPQHGCANAAGSRKHEHRECLLSTQTSFPRHACAARQKTGSERRQCRSLWRRPGGIAKVSTGHGRAPDEDAERVQEKYNLGDADDAHCRLTWSSTRPQKRSANTEDGLKNTTVNNRLTVLRRSLSTTYERLHASRTALTRARTPTGRDLRGGERLG